VLQGEHIAIPARCALPLFAGRTPSGTNRTTLLLHHQTPLPTLLNI
jgi:hypothetical protein